MVKAKFSSYFKKIWTALGSTEILRSGLLISVCIVIGKALSFFWKTLLFKTDPSLLGLSELILTVATVFSSFSLLGMNTALVRFVSKYRREKSDQVAELPAFSLALAIGIFILLSILLTSHLIPPSLFYASDTSLQLSVILSLSLVMTIQEIFLSILLGKKRIFQFGFFKYIVQPFLRFLLLIIFFIFFTSKVAAIPLHLIIAAFLSTLLLSFPIRKSLKMKLSKLIPPTPMQKEFIKYVIPMSGSFITYVLFTSSDIFFLQRYSTLAVIGTYAILSTISEVLDAVLTPFLNLFHTYLGDYTHKGALIKRNILFKQFLFFSFVSGFYIFILFLFRHFILTFYKIDTTQITQILFLFLFAKALNSSIVLPLRHFFDFENHVKMTFIFMILVLILKIALLWYFIPTFGLLGIAFTQLITVVSHVILCLVGWEWYFARKKRSV